MLLLALVFAAPSEVAGGSAVTKVIQLISDLEAKILKEGTASAKVYDEFGEWCEDESKKLGHEIKTLSLQVEDLKATIDKETTTAEEMTAKIEELTAAISVDEKDLQAAKEIRDKEHADFKAEEAELSETISALERAIAILTREMAGAALVQLKSAGSVLDALKVLVQASAFPVADADRLTSFLQASQKDQDGAMGAPDPAAYESKSGGIVATMEDLLDEAKGALDKARNKEAEDLNNFEVLVQTIEDEIKYAEKELAEANDNLAAAQAATAAAEGDLAIATKTLNATLRDKATLHQECMEKAQDYELEMKSRGEELKALAGAKKAISESVAGASFEQEDASLLQMSKRMLTHADLSGVEATRLVRDLGRKLRAPAFSQLAARMERLLRGAATGGDDPFAKVKGLIRDMIAKLLKEAEEEAEEKAFCDKELAETRAKKEDKEDEIAKLTAAIDKATARIAQLTTEIKALQKDLAELAASQMKMDEIRTEEHTLYTSQKAEMEEGIQGVKLALKILKEYYGGDADHAAATGAADGIIGLIEVIESDFTKELTDIEASEKTAAAEYDAQTKENEIIR